MHFKFNVIYPSKSMSSASDNFYEWQSRFVYSVPKKKKKKKNNNNNNTVLLFVKIYNSDFTLIVDENNRITS